MKRRAEQGQAFPLLIVGLLAGCLIAYTAARTSVSLFRATRGQTAADATALAAATAYARGLNVCAASNRLLIPAAIADAIRALGGGQPIFVPTVMKFQDAWAGTSMIPFVGSSVGAAPIYMQYVAQTVGCENGISVVAVWNGEASKRGLMPALNVKRATPIDIALMLTGKRPARIPGRAPSVVSFGQNRTSERFSYQPRGGGPRVEVPAGKVEQITYVSKGKTHRRYRIKSRPGEKAGKFLKREKVTHKIARSLPLPMPLIERSPVHRVLIVGQPLDGQGREVVRSQAETSLGQVFNEFMGDPSFEVRLIPVVDGTFGPRFLKGLLGGKAGKGARSGIKLGKKRG